MSWERLSNMKELYPIEVAEYAEAVGISDEPAFSWLTAHVLKKRQRIIAAVNKRYHTQIWDQGAQNCVGSTGFGQGNGNDQW